MNHQTLIHFRIHEDLRQIHSRFMAKPQIHESLNELGIPTDAYESIMIQLRCLRMHHKFVMNQLQ